ncbi:MAG: GNAT family N-acetyltransferase [Alteromonadaceae bacterium]|nr:GNAT family N-acetyltransferase [Alteromonadaceae bacterium]
MEEYCLKVADENIGKVLKSWFPDAQALFTWGGPGLEFHCSAEQFNKDIKLAELHSFFLTNKKNEFLGFAQTYVRLGRHHFGRVAVSPSHRGKGLGKVLMHKMLEQAPNVQDAEDFSLFVLPGNHAAKSLYLQLGFIPTDYPEPVPGGLKDCLYYVKQQ